RWRRRRRAASSAWPAPTTCKPAATTRAAAWSAPPTCRARRPRPPNSPPSSAKSEAPHDPAKDPDHHSGTEAPSRPRGKENERVEWQKGRRTQRERLLCALLPFLAPVSVFSAFSVPLCLCGDLLSSG